MIGKMSERGVKVHFANKVDCENVRASLKKVIVNSEGIHCNQNMKVLNLFSEAICISAQNVSKIFIQSSWPRKEHFYHQLCVSSHQLNITLLN